MSNLLYKNKKIYKKIQELSKEIQDNIELLDQEERTKQYQKPHQPRYPIQHSIQPQNIILTINDNNSIVIKKESIDSSSTKNQTEPQTEPQTESQTKEQSQKKLNHEKPPAGRVGTRWDPTIIHWKNSLRGYYFF